MMDTIMPTTRRSFLAAAAATASLTNCSLRAFAAGGLGGTQTQSQVKLGATNWQDQGVIDLTHSPHARLRAVPVRAVTIHRGFWQQRRRTNVEQSLPSMHTLLEQHGRMTNFSRLRGQSSAPQTGPVYADSDVYKWTEAASWAQIGDQTGSGQHPELFAAHIDGITRLLESAQEPSGYLNTYYVAERASLRMTPETQTRGHELYNLGHLIQAAVAQYRATGNARLLEVSLRMVNGYLLPNYGPDRKPIVSGHPEIEMSLIELYRITGDRRHLDLAGYILEGDKRVSLTRDQITYMFCGVPFTSRTHLEGHAVRAMYACCGATDYYLETGDAKYLDTLSKLFNDLVTDQMYVNGGVGARRKDEAFGDPFELPNLTAYGESCAAIGNMMWNFRMLHATADARHADVIERALYNGINSGMSLDGRTYCYRNPLAFEASDPRPIRNAWYDTSCCPPNLERTFASLPGYMYSTNGSGLYVHLYHASTLDWRLESGLPLRVEQATDYPWDGRVTLTVSPAHATDFTLYLRIPAWAQAAKVSVAGKPVTGIVPGEYLAIQRSWQPGEVVVLDLPMSVRTLIADHRVAEDQGRVAVERGPLVYCIESPDQQATGVASLRVDATRPAAEVFTVRHRSDLLGGVNTLEHHGTAMVSSVAEMAGSHPLYAAAMPVTPKPQTLTMIPYYAWANRGTSDMAVWIETA